MSTFNLVKFAMDRLSRIAFRESFVNGVAPIFACYREPWAFLYDALLSEIASNITLCARPAYKYCSKQPQKRKKQYRKRTQFLRQNGILRIPVIVTDDSGNVTGLPRW
jgi:hypothetical protein